MADPLSLLRHYNINGKAIEEKDAKYIIFGEFSWPKTVKTNFRIYGSENKETGTWEYYTLECLLYFLKNVHLTHPAYVRQAAGEDVPVVRRPDRRDLLAYLRGTDNNIPKSIDKSARLEMPTHIKRTAEDKLESMSAVKKARVDQGQATTQQELKDRLAAKLDAPQDGKLSINRATLKNLSDDLTTDKIAEIRAKLISNRRTRIKPEDDEAKQLNLGIGDLEVNRESSNIFARERQWRTRTTVLQSTGKNFAKSINAILTSVKMREEGKQGRIVHGVGLGGFGPSTQNRPGMGMTGGAVSQHPQQRNGMGLSGGLGGDGGPSGGSGLPGNPSSIMSQPRQLPNYNRYDQEQFRSRDDTHGFNIETTGTFSGMTLKSVTEGSGQAGAQSRNKQNGAAAANQGSAPGAHGGTSRSALNGQTALQQQQQQVQQPSAGLMAKRPSRTPIIIIPAAPKSLITMYNAKEILQDLRFISAEDKKAMGGAKRENELLIQRRKEGGLTVPYRVIDNPGRLTNADWERVVAVFVMGQAWQFKGWPYDGNPTTIFSKIAAFHLKWDESSLEKNIGNWAVSILQLSRSKRHLDRARLMVFWEILDKYMINNKPHLRF